MNAGKQVLHVKQDVVLWTNSQRPPDDVQVMTDVQPFNVHSSRSRWKQASKDRSDKQRMH